MSCLVFADKMKKVNVTILREASPPDIQMEIVLGMVTDNLSFNSFVTYFINFVIQLNCDLILLL